jgi:hypothetical protein
VSVVHQLPQTYQKVSVATQRVLAYAKSIGSDEAFIYLPYADATQATLHAHGKANVQYMKRVSREYDHTSFFPDQGAGRFQNR